MGEAQFALHWIDYTIVVVYFIGIMGHGYYVSRKLKGGADDYFLAGRTLPWYLIGFSLFASNMSGSSFVGTLGGAYENGVAIYNWEWTGALVLIIFAVFILPSYLRAKVSTAPEFLELRYDVRSRRAFSAFTLLAINQFVVQRALGAKSQREGQLGALFAGFLKLPNIFLLILPGLIALKLYPDLETPDLAFPTLAFELMPIGIRGLIMAALIAAIMSSLDSALNSAGTLFTLDFVKPMKPDLGDETYVKIGRIVTGVCMVIGAIYAPMIAGFPSLFSYFQSSLSYVVPPIVVVYILGLFVPWVNGHGAFWTIIGGLIIGIPMFLTKEVSGVWEAAGLPDIHYTVMSSLLMFAAIASHMGISALTGRNAKEDTKNLVWDWADTKEEFGKIESPIWLDRTILSGVLIIYMVGVVVWFW